MLLVEFYKGAPDLVKFQDLWSQDQTYLDKLKVRAWAAAQGLQPARDEAQMSLLHLVS